MVVMEFEVGRTKIRINDEFCRNTEPEEVELILRQIGENAARSLKRKKRRLEE